MSDEAATSPVAIGSYNDLDGASMQDVLGFDYTCAGCEYNLLGLAIGSECPECGIRVAKSLSRRFLHNANQRWVRGLRSGARLLAIGALLPLVYIVAIIPVSFVLMFAGFAGMILIGVLTFGALLAFWLCFLIGWIMLTSAEPGFQASSAHETVRSKCRSWSIIVAIVLPATYIVSAFSFTMGISQAMVSGVYTWQNMLMMLMLSIIGPIVLIMQFHFATRRLGYLSGRMSSAGLATFARVIFWTLVVSSILGMIQSAVQLFSSQTMVTSFQTTSSTGAASASSLSATPFSAWAVAGLILAGLGTLLFLALYGMYVYLTCWLWAKLSKAARRKA